MCLEKIIKEIQSMKALQALGFGQGAIPCQNLDKWSETEYFCQATKQKIEFPNECLYQFSQHGFYSNKCYELSPQDLLYILRKKEKENEARN